MYKIRRSVVDACQWTGSNWHEMLAFAGKENVSTNGFQLIFNGVVVLKNKWLIKTILGELFLCSNELFSELFYQEEIK